MASIHAIKPITEVPHRMERKNLGVFFSSNVYTDEDPVENQVNVYHAPTLVNVFTDVQFDFETFCAMLAATSVQ